jgi:hypothetical protein
MDPAFSTDVLDNIHELAVDASYVDVDACNRLMEPWLFASEKTAQRALDLAVEYGLTRLLAVAVIEVGGSLPEGASWMLYDAAVSAATALALEDVITESEAAALGFAWSYVADA